MVRFRSYLPLCADSLTVSNLSLSLKMLQKNPTDKSTDPPQDQERAAVIREHDAREQALDAINDARDESRAEVQRLQAIERQHLLDLQRMEQALARAQASQQRASGSTGSANSSTKPPGNSRSSK